MSWLMLITSLPSENTAVRQRLWRALRAAGAGVLRDGVYLMPDRPACGETLDSLTTTVRDHGGQAHLLRVAASNHDDFSHLFDRSADYAALLAAIIALRQALTPDTAVDVLRRLRKLRRTLTHLTGIDFFPHAARHQIEPELRALELACAQAQAPDEPHATSAGIVRLRREEFQGRLWATRQRPWVDRLASGWLIRRHIDPQARLLWLSSPATCPAEALGFDFDGARFTHTQTRVTFEVLAESFGLSTPALARLGRLVHFLDVGGVEPPEAVGVSSVLAGLRTSLTDDDQLLAAAGTVFDGLLCRFEAEANPADRDTA